MKREEEAPRQDGLPPEEAESAAVAPEGENATDEAAAEAEKPAEGWDARVEEPEPPAEPEPSEEEKLRAALAEAQNKFLYLQAEYQNFRKRSVKDVADARSCAYADALTPFMTVFDYLSMADAAAVDSDNIESIRQGLKMIIAEFNKAFDTLGVTAVDAVGKPFDPALHEAVAHEASDSVPEGVVIKQWSSGFKMGGKLLRPARVVVSSGAPEEKPEEETK